MMLVMKKKMMMAMEIMMMTGSQTLALTWRLSERAE